MNLNPMHDWAVIRPSEAMGVSAGGLYIPDTAKDKPQEGIVEAIGPGAYEEEKRKKKSEEKKERRFIPTTVKPGDRVLYGKYAGQTYKLGNEERVLVRERDILGILPERAAEPKPLPPLQIPAATTQTASSALMVRGAAKSETLTGAAAPKKAARKPVVKKVKTSGTKVKKAVKKKASAKPAKKAAKKVQKKAKKKR
jgi:chaperonin GroES